jgi:hypothetical protein
MALCFVLPVGRSRQSGYPNYSPGKVFSFAYPRNPPIGGCSGHAQSATMKHMTRFLTPKTVLGTLVFTLLLGVISSGLWDLLFKPGLTEFGRLLLTIATLGSETIRDFAYASAALNPTPLPALVGVLFASWLPLIVASVLIGKFFGRRTADKSLQKIEGDASGDASRLMELLNSRIRSLERLLNWLTWIFLFIFGGISLTAGSVLNQSVAIWRIFHANLTICAPHISTAEEKQFLARFASVSTRQDYLAVAHDLEEVAKGKGIKLIGSQLW